MNYFGEAITHLSIDYVPLSEQYFIGRDRISEDVLIGSDWRSMRGIASVIINIQVRRRHAKRHTRARTNGHDSAAQMGQRSGF